MNVPLTTTQIPDFSILDINGKQLYLGNAFTMAVKNTTSSATETPIVVIQNPTGSGKSLFFYYRNVTATSAAEIFLYYFNPTLSSTGAATPAIKLRTGSTTSSVTNCYTSPTVTSNGTYFSALGVIGLVSLNYLIFTVDPGSSLLITGFPNVANAQQSFSEISWYEI